MKHRILASTLLVILALNLIIVADVASQMKDLQSFLPYEYRAVQAQELGAPVLVERGRAEEIYQNPDNSFTFRAGDVDVWTYDAVAKEYVPHILRDFGNNTVEVQSGLISWRINPTEAEIYDANFTEFRATERWLPYISTVKLNKFFTGQTVSENSTGVFVTNTFSGSHLGNTITMNITYAIWDGRPTERIVTITGLPPNLADRVNISREWTEMSLSRIEYDGNQEATRTSTEFKTSTDVKDTIRFYNNDELILHENLITAGDKFKEVWYENDHSEFVYTGWTAGTTVITLIDDTYSSTNPTLDGYASTNSGTGTSCPSSSYSTSTAGTTVEVGNPASSSNSACKRGFFEWDITSISDSADITDVVFKFDVSGIASAINCDVMPVTTTQPSTGAAADIWTDIGDGTAYIDNNNFCTSTGNDKSLDLGTSADSDAEAKLSSNWFAVGLKFDDEVRDGSSHQIEIASEESGSATPKPTLEIIYSVTVTVPITLNMRTGSDTPETAGVSFTITCTGGGGTHDGNAASQNFVCNSGVTVTVDVPADTATSRFRFSDGATQKTFSACASGTCSTTTYSDVTRQYKQIVDLAAVPADMPASVTVTRTIVGSSGTQEVDETSADVWPDQGSTISIEDPVSISATERWDTSGTVSWTVDQSRTISNTYYQQFQPDITATSITASVTSVTVTRTQLGGSGTEDIAGSTATGVWVDYNTLVSVEDPVSISANERWDTSGTVSWTQTDATDRATGTYYRQWKQVVDLAGVPTDMPASVTVTRTILNSGGTQEVDETSTEIWADHSTTISIEDPVSISATERWDTSGTVSWTVDQGRTISNTYYQQFAPTVTATSISASVTSVTVTRTQLGSTSTEDIAGSTATTIWADYNTLISVEDPVSISSTERWDTGGTVSWTQTDATNRATGTYYRQWEQTVDLAAVPSDMPASVTVTRTILNSAGTQEVDETSTVIWADHGTSISIEDPVSISATERWDTSGTVSWTVDQGRTIANTYYQQWQPDVTASSVNVGQTIRVAIIRLGAATEQYISGSTATGVWADHNTELAIDDPFTVSATERWDTSGTRSWTVTDATALTSGTYYRQWKQTMDLAGLEGVVTATVTRTILGGSGTQEVDNDSEDIWADHSTNISVEDPISISASERYDTGDTVSFTVDQGRTIAPTFYQQFKHSVTATSITASVTSVTVTRTQLGGSGTEDIAGSTATDIWADDNTNLSIEDPVSISATERWDTSGTVSWTALTSAQSLTSGTYYRQWQQTVDLVGSPADMPSVVTVTRTILNSGGTQEVDETSTVIWADHSTTISIEDPVTISATERWDTGGTVSWTVDQGRTIGNTYYQQWKQTVTATGISASVTSVTVTRTQLGSTSTEDIAGSTATDIWVDNGSTLSVEDPVSISATERWDTSGTVEWGSLGDGAARNTGTYYRQWKQTVDLAGVPTDMPASVTVTRTILGSEGTQEVDETSTEIWADHSTSLTLEDPVNISATERWDTGGTVSYSVTVGQTINPTYYQQFKPTVTATGISASVTSVTVTRTQLGSVSTEDIAGSTATGIWADYNTDISVEDPVSISATERWDTSGTVSWTQTDATNRSTGTYYRQWKQDLDLSGLDAQTVTVTRTILNSAGTQEVGNDAVTIWADHSSNLSLEDPLSISATERYDTGGTVSYTVDQGRSITNAYYHQWGPSITASSITASVTSVTVTRTQLGVESTEDIAGSTATQVWADHNTNISIEDPVSISSTERWDTSGTVSWLQTDATNRVSGTYYRQWKQTVLLDGLDSDQSVSVTRTQLNSAGSTVVSGETSTEIWADHDTSFAIPAEVVITASEERFKSYSSGMSFTVSSGGARTSTWQHEFYTLFRVYEEHEGVIFAPMPDVTFTGSVTTANGTVISTTFFSDDSQDDHSLPITRYWHQNGTQTWGELTWEGITVKPAGATCLVTSYGNCDVESNSKHLGFLETGHFRIGVDDATLIEGVEYDSSTASIIFNATSTGTKNAIVEFLVSYYGDISRITVDGVDHPVASITVAKTSTRGTVTIHDIAFSERQIEIFFVPAGTGSGGGGGGGGGGSGSGSNFFDDNFDIDDVPLFGLGDESGLTVDIGTVTLTPGKPANMTIYIKWTGKTVVEVSSVRFLDNPSWFDVERDIPYIASIDPDSQRLETVIPVNVNVPSNVAGAGTVVSVEVEVRDPSEGLVANSLERVNIIYKPALNLGIIFGGIIGVTVVGALIGNTIYQKRRTR